MSNDSYDEGLNLILELTVLLDEDMTAALAKLGLSKSRVHVLWVLHQGGPSTQKALAEALGVSARNITGLVDALEESGFVTRRQHPDDRRAMLITMTRHGARTAADLERQQHELAHQLFADMPQRRYDTLVKGLRDVVDRVKELIEDAKDGAP